MASRPVSLRFEHRYVELLRTIEQYGEGLDGLLTREMRDLWACLQDDEPAGGSQGGNSES